MQILVIDAQGGGLGKELVGAIRKSRADAMIMAVGTNSTATERMLKAGADQAATGENAVIVASRQADVILGPVGICIADSMMGEITSAMAAAIGQSAAKRILIPFNTCNTTIVGIRESGIAALVRQAVDAIGEV